MKKVIGILIILNILNVADSITTYIGMHGPFYETNNFAVLLFSNFGFLWGNIIKVALVLAFSVLLYSFIKRLNDAPAKFSSYIKTTNYIYFITMGLISVNFLFAVISNARLLINA